MSDRRLKLHHILAKGQCSFLVRKATVSANSTCLCCRSCGPSTSPSRDFRQILQDQEDRVLSPPSPSPTPSSGEDADGDEFYMSANSISFRPAPPPPPVARRPSSSSNASSLG
ncbi:hypothetical protein NQ317_007374 [Molorchus minor]|uniref:Uncharacterized protein n=1 Tax=Molorchus minor TaxID=1323400 RepID=A0ABQ9IYD8_9CUCU|nr:hypothetical protein NQ317_007374 [Molorchus minor]